MDWLDWKIVAALVVAALLGGATVAFGTDILLAVIVLPATFAIVYAILAILHFAVERVRGSRY